MFTNDTNSRQSNSELNNQDDPGAVIVDETSGAVVEIEAKCSDRYAVLVWDGGKAWWIPRSYFNSQLRCGDFTVRPADEHELQAPQR